MTTLSSSTSSFPVLPVPGVAARHHHQADSGVAVTAGRYFTMRNQAEAAVWLFGGVAWTADVTSPHYRAAAPCVPGGDVVMLAFSRTQKGCCVA
jgi:hypothetical protein